MVWANLRPREKVVDDTVTHCDRRQQASLGSTVLAPARWHAGVMWQGLHHGVTRDASWPSYVLI